MDTSKDYYESVMRDFQTYGRGRTLEQYCRDEAVDYKWIEKARDLYGPPSKTKTSKTEKKGRSKPNDMIQLHFESEPTEAQAAPTPETSPAEEAPASAKSQWRVASLKVTTPLGHEIEIMTSNPSAVTELLSKLTA